MTRWDDQRGAEDHRGHVRPRADRLCAVCARHRAQVGDACQRCMDQLLTERREEEDTG